MRFYFIRSMSYNKIEKAEGGVKHEKG